MPTRSGTPELSPTYGRTLRLWSFCRREKRQAFCKLVLEDYLYEQQHQVIQEEGDTEQHSLAPSAALPSLSKYGTCVRWLPDPACLLSDLDVIIQQQQAPPGHIMGVTAHQLILHLFKRCPDFKLRDFKLQNHDSERGDWMKIAMPCVKDLSVYSPFQDQPFLFPMLADFMDLCSSTLEKLTLTTEIGHISEEAMGNAHLEENASNSRWTSLEELSLTSCNVMSNPTVFWTWLLRRCRHVKRMTVNKINGSVQTVAGCMFENMPHLEEIEIYPTPGELGEGEIATLLNGSSRGWKVVKLHSSAVLGGSAMQALLRRPSTLEVLEVGYGGEVESNSLVQVLASCPNLRSLNDAPDESWLDDSRRIDANVFIGLDRDTRALREWACETSLKELKIKIMGIPRPDVREVGVAQEAYPGQGRELQRRVYDRLARLINLEVLCLEGDTRLGRYSGGLEMSFESGVRRLSGLKKLKELNITGMKARIGVQEVHWMTEQWPGLRVK